MYRISMKSKQYTHYESKLYIRPQKLKKGVGVTKGSFLPDKIRYSIFLFRYQCLLYIYHLAPF